MFQETIEVNGKELSISLHRQTDEMNDYGIHMLFCEVRDYVNKGMIVEDSDNPGRYELNDEAIEELSELFWGSFTDMIVIEVVKSTKCLELN